MCLQMGRMMAMYCVADLEQARDVWSNAHAEEVSLQICLFL